MGKPSIRLHDGYTVVDVLLVFEKNHRKGRVAFDADARVAGLFVLMPEVL